MKIIYLIIVFIMLLFIGCSSTYRLSGFPSKEKFYEDFNKSAKDKTLKIILNNDSTFTSDEGAKISNDSLIITIKVRMEEQIISKSEIRAIEYDEHNISNAIILTNGKSIEAKRIIILPDSVVAFNYENAYEHFSLNIVKLISYKDQWPVKLDPLILVTGLGVGMGLGALAGYIISQINFGAYQWDPRSSSTIERDVNLGLTIGSVVGLITGGIIGWNNTYTYIYEFSSDGGSTLPTGQTGFSGNP